jgi:hypothetical protein
MSNVDRLKEAISEYKVMDTLELLDVVLSLNYADAIETQRLSPGRKEQRDYFSAAYGELRSRLRHGETLPSNHRLGVSAAPLSPWRVEGDSNGE